MSTVRPLPPRPNLEFEHKEAKALLRQLRAGDPEAIARARRVWAEAQRRILPRLAVDAGFWLSRSLALQGELIEAEQVVREAVEVAARAGDVPRARHRILRQPRRRPRPAAGGAAVSSRPVRRPR